MDNIADFLIRIKNASLSQKETLVCPFSKFNEGLAKILKEEGFIDKVEVLGEGKDKRLSITLHSDKNKVREVEVKRISKPGRRVYIKAKSIKTLRGLGVTIVSTPQGLMTAKNAIKKSLGGEVVCKII